MPSRTPRFMCDLCFQPLGNDAAARCNSGLHVGPGEGNPFNGRAIPADERLRYIDAEQREWFVTEHRRREMSELQDPPLRMTIEGMRWLGDEWKSTGTSAAVELYATDTGDCAEILRLLRSHLAHRLDMLSQGLLLNIQALDFDAPNAPTESDMRGIEAIARTVLTTIEGLRELAPEVVDEDECEVKPDA